jgi:uncharacterized coiled-coil protein SlyX
MTDFSTTPDELFTLIGEREFIKFKQGERIEELLTQISEMSQVITELRAQLKAQAKTIQDLTRDEDKQDGRLEQPSHHDAIRRFPSGVQSKGRGCGDDVLVGSVEPAGGIGEAGPLAGEVPGVGWCGVER